MSFDKLFEHSDQLFDAALEEFIAKGYEKASINIILKNAEMSKGQFYYHFKTKEALYLSLIDILIAKKKAHLATVMQPQDFQQDIFAILQTQTAYGMAFAKEYPIINRFAESFVREKGNAIYDKALTINNFEDNEAINSLVEIAFQKGEFRVDMPLPFIKKAIGYLFTHAADIADLNNADEFADNIGYLIEFMKTGLVRRQ